jgi:AAA+ superfamily predicted ATPase
MYPSSEAHLIARLERIRQRAMRLLEGERASTPALDDAAAESTALASSVELRLPQLEATFSLSVLARQALECLTAAELDPFLRTLIRAVQREVGRPWLEIGTIAELLDLPLAEIPELLRAFDPDEPLRHFALATCDDSAGGDLPSVSTRVKLSGRVAQHLAGHDILPPDFTLETAAPPLTGSLVPEPAWQKMAQRAALALSEQSTLVVEIFGADGTGKRSFAGGLAAELGHPLLALDLSRPDPRPLKERLSEARRERRLTGAILCLHRWDRAVPASPISTGGPDENEPGGARPLRPFPAPLAAFLEEEDGLVLLTAAEREPLLQQHAEALISLAVPFPTPSQRAELMERALERRALTLAPDVDLGHLMRRFALAPGRIEVAARAAAELSGSREVRFLELQEACRHQLRHDLKSLAERVTSAHKWEDLVIPVDVYHALREMVAYVRHAERVYDEWGFGARHSLAQGVSALFAGPPGTGKTMCASVMARELDMELFRVDLSRVVSKWIGETEKNLGKVFDEAQRSNAIILFDEADALFAKRTEVKSSVDRYANLEINFLLQRMEAFSGVTILTTNFEDTLDTAFKRRLTFRMRFEKPDAEARAALWRKVFPQTAALDDDLDFDRLGALYELSGGNIRNAAVRAAFMAAAEARAIDMHTCMLAAEREAREMGVLIKSALDPEPAGDPVEEALQTSVPDVQERSTASPKLVPITHPREGKR